LDYPYQDSTHFKDVKDLGETGMIGSIDGLEIKPSKILDNTAEGQDSDIKTEISLSPDSFYIKRLYLFLLFKMDGQVTTIAGQGSAIYDNPDKCNQS
jgi:hypothetical protein